MFILSIIFLLFCSFKTFFYGIYELKENKNKPGGIAVITLSIIGFVLNTILISS